MRVSIIVGAFFMLATSAAPLVAHTSVPGETKPVSALVSQVQKLLQNHPDVEAKLASMYPQFSKGDGHLDYAIMRNAANDPILGILGTLISLLLEVPGFLVRGVGSILSTEWDLLGGVVGGVLNILKTVGGG